MKDIHSTYNMAGNLRFEDVVTFLKQTGWSSIESPNKHLMVFKGAKDDDGETINIVLPVNTNYKDWNLRLTEAINLLAELDEVSPNDIIQSIQNFNWDIVKARVIGNITKGNSLPLNVAHDLVTSLKDLFAFAAAATKEMRPHFPKLPSVGSSYVKHCRFAQTFPGSFGFTIESPMRFADLRQIDPPNERKAVERILRGLVLTNEAVSKQSEFVLVEQYAEGFNANMCNALLGMIGKDAQRVIEYSAIWSPHLPPHAKFSEVRSIIIQPNAYSYLEKASDILQSLEKSDLMTISGYVVQLRTEPILQTTVQQVAVIEWKDIEGNKNIHVPLLPNEYRIACDAHRDNVRVSVKGYLQKKGKFWRLLEPQDFKISLIISHQIEYPLEKNHY